MKQLDVSIVIVNWNTRDILRDCLKSIYEETGNIQFQVIVIDNASTDGSQEMIRKKFPQVTLIASKHNCGFATANNQGMAIAKGRYVLLLNSDTIVLDNAIGKTVAFADHQPDVAVVGCRVLNLDGTLQRNYFMFHSIINMFLSATYLYKLFPRNKFFGRQRMMWSNGDEVREVDVVKGCFMLVRREAIEQVGMMDKQFFMYGEETDWCYRFKKASWKVMFTPAGEIIHLGGQSTAQRYGEMVVELRLSILKFIKKHHNWFKYKIACFLTILFFTIRVPIWFTAALLNPRKNKQSMNRAYAYLIGIYKVLFC